MSFPVDQREVPDSQKVVGKEYVHEASGWVAYKGSDGKVRWYQGYIEMAPATLQSAIERQG